MIRKKPKTWQYLFLSTGSVLLLAIAAFAGVSVVSLRQTAYRQTGENLKVFCIAAAHYLDANPQESQGAALQRFTALIGKENEFRVTVIDADGRVVAESNADPLDLGNHADRPEVNSALKGVGTYVTRYSDTIHKQMVYYAHPWQGQVIRMAVTVDYIDTASRQIAVIIVIAALCILLVAVIVSSLVSSRIIDPLKNLEEAAHAYARGELETGLDTGGYPRELAELGHTLALMAANLRSKIGALDANNRETEAILSGMNDALIMLDHHGLIIRANRAAEELFGFQEAAMKGRPLIDAIPNTDIVALGSTGEGQARENAIELKASLHGQGEPGRWLLVKTGPAGEGRTLMVFSDITRLKSLERIRRDFVANVSHELKTPVTSIQGFIETLKEGALEDPAAAKRFLDIMDRQSSRLGAIIDDLLTISRLEQGDLTELVREDGDIQSILDSTQALCAESAAERGTELRFTCQSGIRFSVNPGLIEQALTNLILNGIKYSPPGSIVEVRAEVLGSGATEENGGKKSLLLTVKDNGPGIPLKHRERIFERFYRIDAGRSREMGGTGLGLSIVRHIALAHGGSVTLESAEGAGSTFTILIP